MKKITKDYNCSGIYCIINIKNGKQYIGSSKNIRTRLYNHFYTLKKLKHCNILLQNSWNNNTENDFNFYILEKCEENKLISREQFYIDILKPLYNITLEVDRNILPKESRLKQSNTRKYKIKIGEIILATKVIYKYSLNGEYICKYNSLNEASSECDISKSSICRYINGTYKKAGNYLWSYDYKEILSPYKKDTKNMEYLYKKVQVLDYSTRELIMEFNSLKECAEYFKTHRPSISYAIKVQQKFKKQYLLITI